MNIQETPFIISSSEGLALNGDVYIPELSMDRIATLIFCHGFKGFKDWGAFPYMYKAIASQGIAVVTFNFSRNGIGLDPLNFTELDKFKANTLSLEVEDLLCVISALRSGSIVPSGSLDLERIVLMGHSRGGSAVLRAAGQDPSISKVITLASISRTPPVSPQTAANWRENGVQYVENLRTKQMMPMGIQMLEDLLATTTAIEDACLQIKCPVLIIHGDKDNVVPIKAAYQIESWCENAKVIEVENGDHVFGVSHPFLGTTEIFEKVLSIITEEVK